MKRAIFLCLVVLGTVFAGCHSDDDTWGDWEKVETAFGGVPRVGAVSFTINGVVYAGLGFDVDNNVLTDFWKRSTDGAWKRLKVQTVLSGRIGASAFVLNGKAYVGLGFLPEKTGGQLKTYYKDFYEFNPEDESWRQITAFPSERGRRDAVAFVLNNVAYVGSGAEESDKLTNDFYSFDGTTWGDAGSVGVKRRGGTAFVIDGSAYVCLGYTSGSTPAVDMMKFDGKTWTSMNKLADISDDGFDDDYNQIPRAYAVSFVSGQMGEPRAYIATGTNGGLTRTCWEYSPKTDRWDEVTSLPARANGRVQGISYVVDDYGYVALGGSGFDIPQFDDIWRFDPRIEEDDKNDY